MDICEGLVPLRAGFVVPDAITLVASVAAGVVVAGAGRGAMTGRPAAGWLAGVDAGRSGAGCALDERVGVVPASLPDAGSTMGLAGVPSPRMIPPEIDSLATLKLDASLAATSSPLVSCGGFGSISAPVTAAPDTSGSRLSGLMSRGSAGVSPFPGRPVDIVRSPSGRSLACSVFASGLLLIRPGVESSRSSLEGASDR
ncbi:MAG TPA: hypothetical protein VGT61_07625 [Thermomicrobiales bacterium]|nr:hypothetical protein [Thermomicrobiales bacterium]